MSRLTKEREDEIRDQVARRWPPQLDEMVELLAEIDALRAELKDLKEDRYCSEHGPDCPYFDKAQECSKRLEMACKRLRHICIFNCDLEGRYQGCNDCALADELEAMSEEK